MKTLIRNKGEGKEKEISEPIVYMANVDTRALYK